MRVQNDLYNNNYLIHSIYASIMNSPPNTNFADEIKIKQQAAEIGNVPQIEKVAKVERLAEIRKLGDGNQFDQESSSTDGDGSYKDRMAQLVGAARNAKSYMQTRDVVSIGEQNEETLETTGYQFLKMKKIMQNYEEQTIDDKEDIEKQYADQR